MLIFHYTQIDISIYTTRRLRYPREVLQFFAYIPGAIWTVQHITNIFAFKDHWPHDIHDLAERYFVNITIYKFNFLEGESKPNGTDENF